MQMRLGDYLLQNYADVLEIATTFEGHSCQAESALSVRAIPCGCPNLEKLLEMGQPQGIALTRIEDFFFL